MSIVSSKPRGARFTGLLFAAAVALILIGVVLFVAVAYRQPDALTGAGPEGGVVPMPPPVGDSVTDVAAIAQSSEARLQFVDKRDPTKVRSEMAYKTLDPIGGGFYALTLPRAWIYLDDDWSLYVRADRGRVKMPNQSQQPESGDFVGNVVVLRYPPLPKDGSRKSWDPETDRPALMALTESVSFDTILLELSTRDLVTITTDQMKCVGTGLLVRGNQVRERVEYFEGLVNGRVWYQPLERSDPKPGAVSLVNEDLELRETLSGETARLVPVAWQPRSPGPVLLRSAKEDLYHAMFENDVRVTQFQRTLDADLLELWVRLLDNKLPVGAFGGESATAEELDHRRGAQHRGESFQLRTVSQEPTPTPAMPAAEPALPRSLFTESARDVQLAWSGKATVVPIEASSTLPELADGNHTALRFTAEREGGPVRVTGRDEAIGARGACDVLDYRATTSALLMTARGMTEADRTMWFYAPGMGRLVGSAVGGELDKGELRVEGAGLLAQVRSAKDDVVSDDSLSRLPANLADPLDGTDAQRITWARSADFRFEVEGGRITDRLKRAEFDGAVLARDARASLAGSHLSAEFVPAIVESGARSALSRLYMIGGVEGFADVTKKPTVVPGVHEIPTDGSRAFGAGYLSADEVTVDFAAPSESGSEPVPSRLLAEGSVAAGKDRSLLTTPRLHAELIVDGRGEIGVGDIRAEGGVRYSSTDQVWADSETLIGNAQTQQADLVGERTRVAYGKSVITGTQIHLDGLARAMRVHDAGKFEHQSPLVEGSPTSTGEIRRVVATWSKSMFFNDITGTIECDGDARARSDEPLASQWARGERVRLFLAPGSAPGPDDAGPRVSVERRLLRAEVLGEALERDGGANATVEARFYVPGVIAEGAAGERALSQISYLEGPRIIADDMEGTLTVPAAGKALFVDQSADASSEPGSPAPSSGDGAAGLTRSPRGTSKFEWTRSMVFTRFSGEVDMNGDVELIHKPLADGPIARMTSDRLRATFDMVDSEAAGTKQGRMIGARANGSVYAESGPQRVVADMLDYDARAGEALIEALGEGRVTLYDDRRGSPIVARRLRWNLFKDEVRVLDLAPVVAPR